MRSDGWMDELMKELKRGRESVALQKEIIINERQRVMAKQNMSVPLLLRPPVYCASERGP